MKLDVDLLTQLYGEQPLTVDMLPYTSEYETLVEKYNAERSENASPRDVYITLMNLRKKQQLPHKGRKTTNGPIYNRRA